MTEDEIIMAALIDLNLPKLVASDIPLFKAIVSDLFPNSVIKHPDRPEMATAFTDVCAILQLQPIDPLKEKVCFWS
jgi:dynein heavy chain, axonemal